MITQTIRQGKNVIRIENAESPEDAEKNNFKPSEYSRYFINDNPVSNYMVLIKYIIEETNKNKESFVPDQQNLKKIRREMLEKQNSEMKAQIEKLKEHYKDFKLDSSIIKNIDNMIDKIDEYGIRIIE
jgi:hypothetical protein